MKQTVMQMWREKIPSAVFFFLVSAESGKLYNQICFPFAGIPINMPLNFNWIKNWKENEAQNNKQQHFLHKPCKQGTGGEGGGGWDDRDCE